EAWRVPLLRDGLPLLLRALAGRGGRGGGHERVLRRRPVARDGHGLVALVVGLGGQRRVVGPHGGEALLLLLHATPRPARSAAASAFGAWARRAGACCRARGRPSACQAGASERARCRPCARVA